MNVQKRHPAEQLLLLMQRIYRYGMTTTSGGNLSIRDANGDIWITPAATDKGALTVDDMVCVKADGMVQGNHEPSSEFPFHRLIYQKRPDLFAIVHAHPPALVSFSIVRRIPDIRLLPNEMEICGEIAMAPYALPGSVQLGVNIANVFAEGNNVVMLENHGVVVGASDLFKAFRVFETLDFCARLEIEASRIGQPTLVSDRVSECVRHNGTLNLNSFQPDVPSPGELNVRQELCRFIKRAYDQGLFNSTQGTFSKRINDNEFIITPHGVDRQYMDPEDLVLVKGGSIEAGKTPSHSILFHQEIYKRHRHIDSVIIAHPPHIMAFAVTELEFDSRTIPESYILLRGMPKLPFDALYNRLEITADVFKPSTPIAIVKNNCIVVTGQGLLNTFDRLEVAEYSAKSILAAHSLGNIIHIEDSKIDDLKKAFRLQG